MTRPAPDPLPRVPSRADAGGDHVTAGFTLVELVLVISLIGILAAVAAPRFFERGTFDERGYADELASALRYAQKLAVASGCRVQASVTAGGYVLQQQASLAGHCNSADLTYPTPVILPDGQDVTGSAPAGVVVAPNVNIVYVPAGGTTLGADQAITIGGRTITVVAASGLVLAP